jgi:hypothetical protein
VPELVLARARYTTSWDTIRRSRKDQMDPSKAGSC